MKQEIDIRGCLAGCCEWRDLERLGSVRATTAIRECAREPAVYAAPAATTEVYVTTVSEGKTEGVQKNA